MSASPGDELLTISEIAQELKLHPQTVRNWIDAEKLNALRVGPRRVRVRRSDLDAFLGITPDSQPEESPAAEEPQEDL
jgi:excisionase family DNA binding protein